MFRLQVTIISQTFQYMDMICSVLTVWDPYCLHLLCKVSDIRLINSSLFNILTNVFSKIIYEPINVGLYRVCHLLKIKPHLPPEDGVMTCIRQQTEEHTILLKVF
jgi:hypothetical protein